MSAIGEMVECNGVNYAISYESRQAKMLIQHQIEANSLVPIKNLGAYFAIVEPAISSLPSVITGFFTLPRI